jgi:uncharacterized protein (DUF433 family)
MEKQNQVVELRHPQFTRITINPRVCMGKPCIRGMRFPVVTLVGYLAGGMTMEEILQDFPFLEKKDILEALGFAAVSMDQNYMPLQQVAA